MGPSSCWTSGFRFRCQDVGFALKAQAAYRQHKLMVSGFGFKVGTMVGSNMVGSVGFLGPEARA